MAFSYNRPNHFNQAIFPDNVLRK